MRFLRDILGITGLTAVSGTSVWINGFTVDATDESGNAITFNLDPTADRTYLPAALDGGAFTIAGDVAWEEPEVLASDRGESVLGLSRASAFMQTHQIVTINPVKGKMIVGPFEATPDCREGRMVFAAQSGGSASWTIPLFFDGGYYANELIRFALGYHNDVFVVPRGISRNFFLHLDRQSYRAQTERENDVYTLAQAISELPAIHLTMDTFDLAMPPSEYLYATDNNVTTVATTFHWSPYYPETLPQSVLSRIIVQLDATNNRVGICTPK